MTLEQKIKEIEKKSVIFDNLAKASKHYGLNFCYNATMESGILNSFKNVETIETTQLKRLNLLDLVAEQALTLKQALEVISELQKENIKLKARLQPTPEAPEIDKITCLEADVSLRDDRIKELEKQLDRVRDVERLKAEISKADLKWIKTHKAKKNRYLVQAEYLQNYIFGGEGGR